LANNSPVNSWRVVTVSSSLPAGRVAADALQATERGRASVVPGGPLVQFALGSSRFVPTPLAPPVLARMLKR
jgi:uncharacterized protein